MFVVLLSAAPAQATTLYPDLKTLSPRDLRFDRTDVDEDGGGVIHNVLRFSNTVWNVGDGPLEMRGQIDSSTKSGPAVQRVYDDGSGFTDYTTDFFYYHATHNHYHYDDWGRYELWTESAFDAWLASGRTVGSPMVGTKTTSCMIDEEFIRNLPRQTYPPTYKTNGCFPDPDGKMLQGVGVGWGDTYDYFRPEQWIDLGATGWLDDGTYVLRSVTDPFNKIYESAGKADAGRESPEVNEATTEFAVEDGHLVDLNPPSGSVRINDIDPGTASPNVTVKVLGRDDISGVTQVKFSNDGVTWTSPQSYSGTGSTAQAVAWDLTDPTYGGNDSDGAKTVYAEFKDATGKWSSPESDAITLDRQSGASAYSNSVLADSPSGYWRLGEANGTTVHDSAGSDNGTYANGPVLGQPSLLVGDTANDSVRFDGANDYAWIPSSGSLSPAVRVSLEAWIRPTALPRRRSFASILTKAESYSLQFNGPKLELTIMQNGIRRRLQAPAGTILTGQTYHVVGTYNGAMQRLYVNGEQVASAPLTGEVSTNGNPVTIGSWGGGGEFFDGAIDEPAVYPLTLGPSRVQTHYQAGTGGEPPDVSVAAPTNLTANAVSDSEIDLSWQDNSTNEGEFLIQRDTNSSFTSPTVEAVWADSTSFADTGLAPGTTYYYRVKARNATDSSDYSNTASATTQGSTSPPPSSDYADAVSSDSPISHWRLGESSGSIATDEQDANPGTYVNGPTLGAAGLLASEAANTGVGFDGSNDQVRVGSSTSLARSAPLSLEAWIKPTSLPNSGSFASILTKAESYSLQFNGPKLELTIMQNGIRRRLQAPAGTIQTGQTYHVVGTYDGSTQRLYVNGSEVANAALSGPPGINASSLYLGSWDGANEFFSGMIDEAAVYDTALSSSRVSAHYQAGS